MTNVQSRRVQNRSWRIIALLHYCHFQKTGVAHACASATFLREFGENRFLGRTELSISGV